MTSGNLRHQNNGANCSCRLKRISPEGKLDHPEASQISHKKSGTLSEISNFILKISCMNFDISIILKCISKFVHQIEHFEAKKTLQQKRGTMSEIQEEKKLPAVGEEPIYFRKSNTLITAKYKLPMFCHKLMNMSLNRLEPDGLQMKAVLYPAEIRALLGAENDSNIYKKLKRAAELGPGSSRTGATGSLSHLLW